MSGRLDYIDVARGIGILAVVIGHTCYPSGSLAKFIFLWHMPLFFCLSGLLFNPDTPSSSWFARRFNSLLVPYITTMLISFGYWLLVYRYIANDLNSPEAILPLVLKSLAYGTGQVVEQLPDIAPVGPLWFLPALFSANAIFFLIVRTFSANSLLWLWIAAVVCSAFGVYLGKQMFLPWSLDIALAVQIFIAFGYLALPKILGASSQRIVAWTAGALIVISYIATTLSMNNRVYGEFLMSAVGACAGVVLLLLFSRMLSPDRIPARVLSYIGRASMVIMCFHAVDATWGHFETFIPFYTFLTEHWVVHALVRILVCLMLYEVIRRSPLKTFFGTATSVPSRLLGHAPEAAKADSR